MVTLVPAALTIAGFDPSSGAGISADLKTFAAHGVYGLSCISAMTVQSTSAVRSVQNVSATLIRQTLDCLADDIPIAGVKIGMLGSGDAVGAVLDFLAAQPIERRRIVFDPVLRSSSGTALFEEGGLKLLREGMLAKVGWITPNLSELEALTGMSALRHQDIPGAARVLRERTVAMNNPELNIVVTGGDQPQPNDFLLTAEGEEIWVPGEMVETTATHGTGCAFSSALLCRLIAGDAPLAAVVHAKKFVTQALRSAYSIGKGRGPMHHLFRLTPCE